VRKSWTVAVLNSSSSTSTSSGSSGAIGSEALPRWSTIPVPPRAETGLDDVGEIDGNDEDVDDDENETGGDGDDGGDRRC